MQQRLDYAYGTVDAATSNVDATKNNGQLGRVETFTGGTTTSPNRVAQQRFTYDSLGRLKQSSEMRGDNLAQVYLQTFSYDRFGNRYQKAAENQNTGIGYLPIEDADISKSTNRLASASVTYDDAGNMTIDNRYRSQS